MKRDKRHQQAGFILMGMAVGFFLVAIVVGPIWFHYHTQNRRALEAEKLHINLKETAREGLYKMIKDIAKAGPGQFQIGPNGDSITVMVPGGEQSAEIRYTLSGNGNEQLVRTNVSTGESYVVAEAVDKLSFMVNGSHPAYVTIKMDVQPAMLDDQIKPGKPHQLIGQAEIQAL